MQIYYDFAGFEKNIPEKIRNYSKKGLSVTLLHLVTKKIFYGKSCVFSKESTWHMWVVQETVGNGSKLDFRAFMQ